MFFYLVKAEGICIESVPFSMAIPVFLNPILSEVKLWFTAFKYSKACDALFACILCIAFETPMVELPIIWFRLQETVTVTVHVGVDHTCITYVII